MEPSNTFNKMGIVINASGVALISQKKDRWRMSSSA
ncbi:hypothetical protein KS4_04540 [Poriferisphaera corsica]|uniref:Uncharacterized protein n=1 Tax=Poriferisphaera corsica TaxID=2528020 RepID=A0A517YQC7_9BACT|nr:hypothetical protein KS4_04540 [Poriferisphaera corsica]